MSSANIEAFERVFSLSLIKTRTDMSDTLKGTYV